MIRVANLKRILLATAVLLPVLVSEATAAHATTTTVAQWKMDELSGTTMTDSSGTGNNGVISGVSLGAPGSTGASGDYAFGFDGAASQIKVANSSSLSAGSNDMAITLHVNTTTRPGTGSFDFDLLRKGGAFSMEIYPSRKGTAQAKCKFNGSHGKLVFQAGPDLIDGAWHTLTCKKTTAGITLTVDGTSYFKGGDVGDIKTNSKPVAVGWQTDSTDFYKGLMDDVSIVIG